DNVAAMKILAPRPIRAILVALASGIRRVVFAVLVLMGRPAEPASVERQLDPRGAGRRHAHRLRDFRTPLVPGVQHPCARRHGGDFEAAVRRGLREVATRHHLHECHHSGVDVAEDAHQAGTRERPGRGLAAAVLPEVERIGPGGGDHVVVEGVVIRKADRWAERTDHDAGHELLIVERDVDGHRAGGIDKEFVPRVVVVPLASTVRFPNHDPFDHNVFSVSGPDPFDLGQYGRGDAKTWTFTSPGLVRVFCNIHPRMVAFVQVMAGRHYTQPAADGSFEISPVPPGTWVLHAWHERSPELTQTVSVTTAGASGIELALDARGFRW